MSDLRTAPAPFEIEASTFDGEPVVEADHPLRKVAPMKFSPDEAEDLAAILREERRRAEQYAVVMEEEDA